MASSGAADLRKGVGRRIAAIRRAAALTQEKFAEALGVTARYVQSVEAGRENLTLDTLAKIAKVLRADVAELVVGSPALAGVAPPDKARAKPAGAKASKS